MHRVLQLQLPVGDERRRVRLAEPGADQDVLADPAEALIVRQPPEHLTAERERERNVRRGA